jgi:hypothetical protein
LRRSEEVRAADYRGALTASVMATALTGKPISPEELLGESDSTTSAEPDPGSSDETAAFLAAMGAEKRPTTESTD